MPTEYFEQRERALLGQRYEQLYAAPQQTAERGVTVSALRTTPEQFAQRADFQLEPSPFCKAAFVVHQPDLSPGGIRTTMRVCSTRRSHRPLRQRRCWGYSRGCGCWTCAPRPAAKAASWRRHCRDAVCW